MSFLRGICSLPKQVVLTMQATAVLLFAFCLQVSAVTYSQTVSFTGKDVPLKTVFASVKKQTGYGMFYANGEDATLEGAGNVTLDVKNIALDLFLSICLKDKPLEYSLEGTTIFIKKKEARTTITVELSDSTRISEIKGRVTNDKGEPLANANVTLKRTGRGTVTDANGRFSLQNVNSEDVLQISFIGYRTQRVPVQDRTSFTMVMEPATSELDKMVVQAYGQTSQRLATGNIGVVRASDIARQPIMNPLQALQGQVPGVAITNVNGYASGTVKVEIRGRNTINSSFPSDPLYIIDGVPLTILELTNGTSYSSGSLGVIQSGIPSPANGQSPFFSINPADIESVEILKDADATAIYGSRGSNGVILITTKKGKIGKTHFDFNIYTGLSQNIKYYKMLNTSQYVSMRKEALINDRQPIDMYTAPDIVIWDTSRYTNWQKFLWGGLGKTTDAQGSLSGGNIQTSFRVGAAYHYQKDILVSSGANQRGSFSFNLNHKSANQKLNVNFSALYSAISVNTIYTPGAISLPPNAPPIFTDKSSLNFDDWRSASYPNPFQSLLVPYSSKTNLLNSNFTLTYELLKGLSLKASLGYNNSQTTQSLLTPIASQDPASNPTGSAALGYTFLHNSIFEPQIEYNRFISNGKLSILTGASIQRNSTSSAYQNGFGYGNDALLTSISNAPSQTAGNSSGEYRYIAAFGRINYNWKNTFILNLNARRDASSKFGPGRQFGNFGSIGAAWIFTEANWIKKNIPLLSFGKLRANYGTTGGDQIRQYAYLSAWTFSPRSYNSVLVLTPSGHYDSTLHWQVNYKLEAAINLSFLNDRVNFEAVWYRNQCKDQLIQFPTPVFTGFGNVISNSPANVENRGWEFSLNAKIIDNPKLKWSTRFNIGINRNRLLAYPNLSQSPYADQFIIGKPLNISKMLHSTGVDPQTGLYSFQDKDKDGQIVIDLSGQKPDDRFVYDINPKFHGGFTNTITYKNWDVSFFFYFIKQKGFNAYNNLDVPGGILNQPTAILNRWQKPGDIANVARFTTNSYATSFYNYKNYSDGVFSDASFIRLQNLSIGYMLPENFIRKYGINNCKVYIQGDYIFLISHYNGIDPEVQNFGSLPMPRILTAGISCNF